MAEIKLDDRAQSGGEPPRGGFRWWWLAPLLLLIPLFLLFGGDDDGDEAVPADVEAVGTAPAVPDAAADGGAAGQPDPRNPDSR